MSMTIHWAQVAATTSSLAGIVAVGGAIYYPYRKRRDDRLAAKTAARDAELKRTVREAITGATEQIKVDTIARIDASDERVDRRLTEIKGSVEKLRERAEQTDIRMAVQFGGNGGGIREAINKQADALTEHGERIARVAGQFEQHLKEVGGR